MDFINQYFIEAKNIIDKIDRTQISKMVSIIHELRSNKGRMFILGVGGGAGHASHAVNDFRTLFGISAYTPTDNVSELTARVNDDGWETASLNWFKIRQLNKDDMLFVCSVGGGHLAKNISVNIIKSHELAKQLGSKI